jgi:ribose transport system permease protein
VQDVSTERASTIEHSTLTPRRRAVQALSFRNISAVYILAVLFAVYALWVPDTFLTVQVWKSLLASGAITALATVGLVLPLAAGIFNLAVGAEIGFGAIVFAWLLAEHGVPVGVAVLLVMAVSAGIGVVSGLLITKARIDSFITTLGMSSILLALIAWVSDGQQILNLGTTAQEVATGQFLGIARPVWTMLFVGLVVWYVLQRTPVGRRIYATGGNAAAARLAGVRTSAVIVAVLAACGAIAGLSGSLISAQLATGDPTVGPAYMLPAYAAAFLGSTQFRGGRYNVWGAVLAVYVLAVGVKGLQLGGAPTWIPDLFNGAALILAVGMARFQRTAARSRAVRRTVGRNVRSEPGVRASSAVQPVGAAGDQALSGRAPSCD